MVDFIFHVISTVLFTVLFLAVPYKIVRRKHAIILYSPKLILYFCTELSFAPDLWDYYREKLTTRDEKPINIPLKATINGIIMYPLSRAFLFAALTTVITGATIWICTTFELIQVSELQETLPLPMLLTICCGPFLLYYLTSFSSDSYAMMKNQRLVKNFLGDIGWKTYTKSQLKQLYNEVQIDFLLYKKTNDLGTILIFIGSGVLLAYSRVEKVLSTQQTVLLISMFAAIVISKTYYEGYRTRIIYIAINTLLELIEKADDIEEQPLQQN